MFNFARMDARRKELGITQAFIASAIERTPTIYQDWKRGKSSPNQEQIKKLADILDTTIEYLTGQTDEKKPTPVSESGLEPERIELIELVKGMDMKRVEAFLVMLGEERE